MPSHFRYYLSDYRLWMVLGLLATAALAYQGAHGLWRTGLWLALGLAIVLLGLALFWLLRRLRARRMAGRLDAMVTGQADRAVAQAAPAQRGDVEALRTRMLEAVKAIKSSRLGLAKGKAALYELPWYVIIGNPAAGKSSAILNSGLQFPFQDNRSQVIQGIGGTRNCDWYFTTTGIVLDTAGRYSVSHEDRSEWLSFLALLKSHRPRAPINGIIIAASIAELSGSKPEFAMALAKNLRLRVQEITERLEVFAPVYVLFTKADLIAGFAEFFQHLDPAERESVWGVSLAYDPSAQADALTAFDTGFDELVEGVKAMGLAHMAMQRGRDIAPGLLTLPLEFVAIKPALRTFIATLFEDNPYQFKPVFRGFYFSSALQEGRSVHHASERVGQTFALQPASDEDLAPSGQTAYFLKDLFRKVVFPDQQLVQQYSSPHHNRLRRAVFFGAVAVLALAVGLWTWSYTTNARLVANASRDLQQAVQLQQGRVDLQSRIEALLLLQDRIGQLQHYEAQGGLTTRLGLYQGQRIKARLLAEYAQGMRQVMLVPVTANLEAFLTRVVSQRAALGAAAAPAADSETLYQEASPTRVTDAYNALKTYLMLGSRGHLEPAPLAQQLTLFWRQWLDANRGQMTREQMLRAGDKLMSFYVSEADALSWPLIQTKVALVNDTREALVQVMKGQPALQRVYAQIKARAAARFPTITVDQLIGVERNGEAISGSYAISGAFSRQAWADYIKQAIKEAANTQLSTTDWVLGTTEQSDLSLAGSPEHIARELGLLYKQEYAREWGKFMAGLGVAPFADFGQAVQRMNRLGDPVNSPLKQLLQQINAQTLWDNPLAAAQVQRAQTGVLAWFKRVVLRQNPLAAAEQQPLGPIGKAFAGLARVMAPRQDEPPVIDGYFQTLAKLRSRLNRISNQGEIGVGTRKLMQDTLGNDGSELSAALAIVDEQVLTGLDPAQRDALRPLLLRPLTQCFAALIAPTEAEINRSWTAQVYQPFQQGIGQQYPFKLDADVDAAASDIALIFGGSGAIAAFVRDALGNLVLQRGSLLEARRWAGLGISLSGELIANYGHWISNQGGGGASTYIFQLTPAPATGAVEYTITIDGQSLRYRNTPPQPVTMQYPNPSGTPGARISAVSADGRTIQIFDSPGQQGLGKLFAGGRREDLGDGSYNITWSAEGISVPVQMRIIQDPSGNRGGSSSWQHGLQLPATVAGTPATTTATGLTPAGR